MARRRTHYRGAATAMKRVFDSIRLQGAAILPASFAPERLLIEGEHFLRIMGMDFQVLRVD